MSRLDAIMVQEYTTRDGEKKSSFTKIGVAFPLKAGNGYQAILHAIPAAVDGQIKILLMEPKQEKRQGYVDDRGVGTAGQSSYTPQNDPYIDGEAPF